MTDDKRKKNESSEVLAECGNVVRSQMIPLFHTECWCSINLADTYPDKEPRVSHCRTLY